METWWILIGPKFLKFMLGGFRNFKCWNFEMLYLSCLNFVFHLWWSFCIRISGLLNSLLVLWYMELTFVGITMLAPVSLLEFLRAICPLLNFCHMGLVCCHLGILSLLAEIYKSIHIELLFYHSKFWKSRKFKISGCYGFGKNFFTGDNPLEARKSHWQDLRQRNKPDCEQELFFFVIVKMWSTVFVWRNFQLKIGCVNNF